MQISLLKLWFLTSLAALPPSALASAPLPPSQDPWYTAPPGYQLAKPGDVLRIRHAPGNLTALYNHSSAAYNILYRTTDSHSHPLWAVTTLFVPKETDGSALLSYQIPYNTADVDGSASVLLYEALAPGTELVYSDVQNGLRNGWFVSSPDYNGPSTSFGAGLLEGKATLDSIRAVKHAGLRLTHDAKIALWGYSGGSIASEWAAEQQAAYAPDLNIVGAALGGLPANLTDAIPVVTGTQWAGLIPEITLGLFSQYPDAMFYLLSQLKDSGPCNMTSFLHAKDLDIAAAFTYYSNQDIYTCFKDGAAFFQHPVVRHAFRQETYMGFHGVPQVPLFIYQAVHDELARIRNTEALVRRYCSVGVDVLFERNVIGGHLAEETNGDQRALKWLETVLGGKEIEIGCVVRDVTLNVTDSPL